MEYAVFESCEELQPFVKCYWTLVSPATKDPERQRIVPDGCMELIFHLGDLYKQYVDAENFLIQPRCFVIGQLTQVLEIEPTGDTHIFSVRFQPQGFTPFAHVALKKLENKACALEDLFGDDGLELEQLILNASDTQARIRLIEKFLLHQLMNTETINQVVKSTVDTMIDVNGRLAISDLSQKLQLNRRQLERKFASAVGLSPKQLSKIIRLQHILKQLINKEFNQLSDLAYEGEYFDQAHFIRDFKEFTGLTPKEFYGENLKMSTLFYGKA